jgi:hypothetical protein
MIGAKGKADLGKSWFAEAYLGIGFVQYSSVDAEGFGVTFPLFEDSIAFAWEIGTHVGYKFTPKFGVIAGLGYEVWGAPSLTSDAETAGFPDPDPVKNVTFDVGIWFRF